MSPFIIVAKKKDIPEGTTKTFIVDDKDIAISCIEGHYYAFINVCSHMELPLAEGEITGTVIECPHHGAQFDLKTGEALSMPAVTPIQVFDVKVEGEDIKVNVG